ncbi:MAG: PilZ domain-containing protein [Candidatus Omnitrophota bacterium]
MKLKLPERRRFVRIDVPLRIVVKGNGYSEEVLTKNISPLGFNFEANRKFEESESLSILLYIPSLDDPVSILAKVVWQNKVNLEDNAPYDMGVEIVEIDDTKKDVFLKYLCDLLYESVYEERA